MRLNWVVLFTLLVSWQANALAAGCLEPAGDLDSSGSVNVVDVQCSILTNLYFMANDLTAPLPECAGGNMYRVDINCDVTVSVTDVMLMINLSLGFPMSSILDADGNSCPDTCDAQIACLEDSDCDDGDLCTVDSCSPDMGCVYEWNASDPDADIVASDILFSGDFGGTYLDGDGTTYVFPSWAESWAGFANEDTSFYPLSFPYGGNLSFTGSAAAPVAIEFKFEKNPFPDVDPHFYTEPVIVEGEGETYTVEIPEGDGSLTYSSFLLFVLTQNEGVTLTDVTLRVYSEDKAQGACEPLVPCSVDADCDDGDPCTVDSCGQFGCLHAADTTDSDDNGIPDCWGEVSASCGCPDGTLTPPDVVDQPCTIDLSMCSEDEKASSWQGESSLQGVLTCGQYLDKTGMLCMTDFGQGWPVEQEAWWWCGEVTNSMCTIGPPVAPCNDPCEEGEALNANCGTCTASVCDEDPYCCNNSWDDVCVGIAESLSACGCPG